MLHQNQAAVSGLANAKERGELFQERMDALVDLLTEPGRSAARPGPRRVVPDERQLLLHALPGQGGRARPSWRPRCSTWRSSWPTRPRPARPPDAGASGRARSACGRLATTAAAARGRRDPDQRQHPVAAAGCPARSPSMCGPRPPASTMASMTRCRSALLRATTRHSMSPDPVMVWASSTSAIAASRSRDRVVAAGLPELQRHERRHPVADGGRVDVGPVAGDHAAGVHAGPAVPARCRAPRRAAAMPPARRLWARPSAARSAGRQAHRSPRRLLRYDNLYKNASTVLRSLDPAYCLAS